MLRQIQVFTDGASRGNPGQSGAGVFIKGLDEDISVSIYLGEKTNNEAEYLALLAAVSCLLQLQNKIGQNSQLNASELVFKMDSLLVVKQMSCEWKIKEARMQQLVDRVRKELDKLGLPVIFKHIERERNQQADQLANLAIDLGSKI